MISYNSLISAFGTAHLWAKAMSVLETMQEKRFFVWLFVCMAARSCFFLVLGVPKRLREGIVSKKLAKTEGASGLMFLPAEHAGVWQTQRTNRSRQTATAFVLRSTVVVRHFNGRRRYGRAVFWSTALLW